MEVSHLLDRIVMLLADEPNLRDCVVPMTGKAEDLMMEHL